MTDANLRPAPQVRPNCLLRGVLAVLGAAIVALGLNIGLGGIQTLGWQGGKTAFLTVTDPQLYALRDSHVRFIGGVWLALGLMMLASSVAFRQLRPVVIALVGMIFVGGLTRLGGDLSLVFSAEIGPSFLFESLGAPLLGIWCARAERRAEWT